jgi:tetraacyldisaccharide 4'-kinase
MVRSSDNLRSRLLLSGEFPLDRAVQPAFLTVPLSWLYGLGVRAHNGIRSLRRAYRPPVPVISVGNITVGGTGKTPCVIELIRWITARQPHLAEPNAIAVLSRGYGRIGRGLVVVEPDMDYEKSGDEPLLVKRALPQAAVVVHASRSRAARFAVEKLGTKLLILDDGFQHRALARDLSLVLLDLQAPFGNGYLLPAGPLREPARELRRAHAVAFVGHEARSVSDIERLGLPVLLFESELDLPPELSTDLSTKIWLLTSIARPTRLYNQLINKGIQVAGHSVFPDHCRFSEAELRGVAEAASRARAGLVLTTAKDRVRIPTWPSPLPLRLVNYRLIVKTPDILGALLEPVLEKAVA